MSGNALRRSALESDDGSADSSPDVYTVICSPRRSTVSSGLRRRSLVLAMVPTTKLATQSQTAGSMPASAAQEFRTPDNSECSEESSVRRQALVRNRHKYRTKSLPATGDEPSSSSSGDVGAAESSLWSSSSSLPWSDDFTPPLQLRRVVASVNDLDPTTYTKICFNPDPLGECAWYTYFVPDTRIDQVQRAFLIAASESETLDPLRICECHNTPDGSLCTSHAPPDMASKVVACFMLDSGVATIPQRDLRRLIQAHRQMGHITMPGVWQNYRVRGTKRFQGRVSATYQFKMFYA